MREILCKGKRKDNGEWICGEYITIYDDPKYKAIKTCIVSRGRIYIMWADGSSDEYDTIDCKKTGRHFSQVEELLKEMKNE